MSPKTAKSLAYKFNFKGVRNDNAFVVLYGQHDVERIPDGQHFGAKIV